MKYEYIINNWIIDKKHHTVAASDVPICRYTVGIIIPETQVIIDIILVVLLNNNNGIKKNRKCVKRLGA